MEHFINTLTIENFKSLKHIEMGCKRINVFIGKPNVGKSNLLEALGMFSFPYFVHHGYSLKEIIRFDIMANLFHDNKVAEQVRVDTDRGGYVIFQKDDTSYIQAVNEGEKEKVPILPNRSGLVLDAQSGHPRLPYVSEDSDVRYYKFRKFQPRTSAYEYLLPPYGDNLYYLLYTNKELRQYFSGILKEYDLRLVLNTSENMIQLQKEVDDIVFTYPYSLMSDGLQKLLFIYSAIESNKQAIVLLEEPESNYFPFYSNVIAERIALYSDNQFFITTHNPYFLTSLLTKAPAEDVNIGIVYFENHETKVHILTQDEIQEVVDNDLDVFFNTERFLENH